MKIYVYEPITKEYVGSLDVNENEVMPANTTIVEPPFLNINEVCIFENGEWIVLPNYKFKVVYEKATGRDLVYDKFGDLPSHLTSLKCPNKDLYSWNGSEWVQDLAKYISFNKKLRERELNSLQWLFSRHDSEKRLISNGKLTSTTLSDGEISSLDEYFQAWRGFFEKDWYIGKIFPQKPSFLGDN